MYKNIIIIYFALLTSGLISCKVNSNITTVGFGSCGHQDHPLPILDIVNSYKPDYFVFLGDNIYGDTDNMDTLKYKYQELANHKNFQTLMSQSKVMATWDDHDFGQNDSGKEYPYKEASKNLFLDFFKEPLNSTRRNHSGIYHSEFIKKGNKTLQIILLDNRTFRDTLLSYAGQVKDDNRYFYELDYNPHTDTNTTLLGDVQWQWLEKELLKPADLRLICSGTQFSIEYNGYEAWANFPHERKRMLDLINKTKAEGVVFLTGDVHYAEFSKLSNQGGYPIYDFTASGLSSTWKFATPNINRFEGPVMDNHFGLLSIDWSKSPIQVKAQIIDDKNNLRMEYQINKTELEF